MNGSKKFSYFVMVSTIFIISKYFTLILYSFPPVYMVWVLSTPDGGIWQAQKRETH